MDLLERRDYQISEPSAIFSTRSDICKNARLIGFGERKTDSIAVVVNELGTNLVKHAKNGGSIIFQASQSDEQIKLQVISLNNAPGINEVELCLKDGYSTAGSLGTGLGAIRRMSDDFQMYSDVGSGTIVATTFLLGRNEPGDFLVDGISVPKRGELACGDYYCWKENAEKIVVLVADGLGHGPQAATASKKAGSIFSQNYHLPLLSVLNLIHEGLRGTRGAAVGICQVDKKQRLLSFAGIGNVVACLESELGRNQLLSMNGIAGYEARTLREWSLPWTPRSTLIIYTDGLSSHWTLSKYPGIKAGPPIFISAALFRDHRKPIDDCTVVTIKEAKHA